MNSDTTEYADDINKVLSEITGAIVGQFDLGELLDRIVSLSMRLLHAEVCSIFLEDRSKLPGRIRMMAGSGFAKALVGKAEYKIGEGFTGFVAQTGRKFNITGKDELIRLARTDSNEPVWMGKHDAEQWESGTNEFRNLIALPLKIRDRIFGVIKVENKEISYGHSFSERDEGVFEIIANVVAMAIENARLHSQTESQLKAISAKAAHRINNQAANYDGIELDIEDELKADVCSNENLRRIQGRLIETTMNLKRMIAEFKSYGKPILLNKTPLSINRIIEDEIWYSKPSEEIAIEQCLDDNLPNTLLDGGRFAESIKELINNAITSITNSRSKKGLIRISTKLFSKGNLEGILVSVEDNGPGFPPNFPVFEPFNSTNPQSTGLGLATVKELVEKHGGEIWVRASALGGSCVEFVIPIQEQAGE